MNDQQVTVTARRNETRPAGRKPVQVDQHIVEIVSDSGEGAQKAGQIFGTVSAKMGNGVWTVEIIPAEIKPPARSRAGASGIRVRLGSKPVTNMGDEADLVVAFNEQVLYGRITQDAFKEGTIILLENKWAQDRNEAIRTQYAETLAFLGQRRYQVFEIPIEEACLEFTSNPRVGKNMFVLGMLCYLYGRDLERAKHEIVLVFGRKGEKVIALNHALLEGGYAYAEREVPLRFEISQWKTDQDLVVMNGNQAVGLGVMAAGMEVCSMYPITPATSASHYLSSVFEKVGGVVHQAEDEIAAIGFAIGCSYAGKTAVTITSGPGMALKTEFIALAIIAEIPLVIVDVQRGGPSTGLPTKVEQGDLLYAVLGQPGDAPKVVMAAATIEECFHFIITARKIAESFRMPVIVLTDANLATGVQPFERPRPEEAWLAPPIDQSPWDESVPAYAWNEETGISARPIPGQAGGEHVLTGLAHTRESHVAYDPASNQLGGDMRSRKLSVFQKTLVPPKVNGDPEGKLLIVGWGSTLGAITEAVDRARAEGRSVSSLHLRFLSPLEPGLKEIFQRFEKVMTVEIDYSDDPDAPNVTEESRRYSQLPYLLRAKTLVDVDCWSNVHGHPLAPRAIYDEITRRLERIPNRSNRSNRSNGSN